MISHSATEPSSEHTCHILIPTNSASYSIPAPLSFFPSFFPSDKQVMSYKFTAKLICLIHFYFTGYLIFYMIRTSFWETSAKCLAQSQGLHKMKTLPSASSCLFVTTKSAFNSSTPGDLSCVRDRKQADIFSLVDTW